jgi:carboxymethylenebutenolidase
MNRTNALWVATAFLFVSCGGDSESGASGQAADGGAPSPAAQETTVRQTPTGADQLPPAIVGEGGDLMGMTVRYVPGDDATEGYLAVPSGEGPFPALVIVHEWNGLVDRVRQVADDLAAEGYVVLAADLYQGQVGTTQEENIELMTAARGDEAGMIANLDAAVAFLRARDDVTGRVGSMGWCFGGGVVLTYGLGGVNHDATAIFYGQLLDDPQALEAMDHEVYGTFAQLDGGPAPDDVARFEAALDQAGVEHDLHIYDEVNHGFWLRVDGDPETRSAPALDAWQRLKAYLDRTLRN